MSKRVLLLTPWETPHNVLTWKDAVTMKWEGTAEVLYEYEEEVCSPSITWKLPAVMRLKELPYVKHRGVKFSRQNIFIRDNYTCQYCGKGFIPKDLTYDHVLPRTLGGKTDWNNIVSACKICNMRKGSKTCKQFGYHPLNVPVKPKSLPFEPSIIEIEKAPKEWLKYL